MKNEELDQIIEKSFGTEPGFQLPADFAQKVAFSVVRRQQWKADLREYFYLLAVVVSLLAVVFGFYYFGYIPDQSYIGASKIGRTVDHFAAKLQTAECLVREVLDHIEKGIHPLGSILLMNGRHLCKEMRVLRKSSR